MRKLIHFTLLYIILLAFHGYTFGENDQIEQLSYTKYFLDNSLYPKDFYIQHITAHIPNERYFTTLLLSFLGNNLEWGVFIGHYLCSLMLFYGLFQLAKKVIKKEGWIWFALIILFIPLYKYNLGGNDLYYDELLSSNLSKAFGVWAFVFFLDNKYYHFVGMAIIATFFHAVAGAQVMVLATGSYFVQIILNKNYKDFFQHNKTFLFCILAYALSAGVWLLLLFKNYESAKLSNDIFFNLISFRIPHHFRPSVFGLKNYLIVGSLLLFGLNYNRKKNAMVFGIFLTCLLIAGIYTISTEVFHSILLFSTQWFKATIWLKAFATFAFVAWISDWLIVQLATIFHLINVGKILLYSLALFSLFQLKNPIGNFQQKKYHFPFSNYKEKSAYDIALKVKALTPKEAVFVQPSDLTSFKFFSERSSFIDYKTVVHSQAGFQEWYKRVQAIYGISIENREKSMDVYQQANQHFYQLHEQDFMAFSSLGVTHILTKKTHQLNFKIIAENQDYVVYGIRE